MNKYATDVLKALGDSGSARHSEYYVRLARQYGLTFSDIEQALELEAIEVR